MNQNEEFVQFISEKLIDVGNLFAEKNMQYATVDEPLSDFTRGAMLLYGDASHELLYQTAKDYLAKHIAFLYAHGIVNKAEESLMDMVVYGLIMLYIVEKQRQQDRMKRC